MPTGSILRFLNPRQYRRNREAERVQALITRDGGNCARCRRPLRFDLPAGHDLGAIVEPGAGPDAAHLCHRRCNRPGTDHTEEVTERVKRKHEAALFGKTRKRRAA